MGKRKDGTRSCEKCRHLVHMYPMAEFLREKRWRWFGHVQRWDKDEATRNILQITVNGKQNRGRPKLRWRDLVKDDMARNQMTTEMAEDRKHWHVMIGAGTLPYMCKGGKVRNILLVVWCFSKNLSHNFSFIECKCCTDLDGVLDVSDPSGDGIHPLLQPGPTHCQHPVQQPILLPHPSLSISWTCALVSQL